MIVQLEQRLPFQSTAKTQTDPINKLPLHHSISIKLIRCDTQ